MGDIKLSRMVKINTSEAVDIISNAYISLIKSGKEYSMFPSIMLWGAPGVGKSRSIREIAKNIEKETKKKVNITDVRLILFNPVDLRGIPTANADKTLSMWLKPKIFDMDESNDIVNILFLDEISSAPSSVQAAAYQITLDRVIGEHRLPKNCIVICAGNRLSDKSIVSKMPKALANRLLHLEIDIDAKKWLEWAKNNNINKKVINFIKDNQSYLMGYNSANEDFVFPTPRTWEMVSDVINVVGEDNKNLETIISGLVGEEAAFEFINYITIKGWIPTVEDFLEKDIDYGAIEERAISILKNRIIDYAYNIDWDEESIKKLVSKICKMPFDYAILVFKSCFNMSNTIEEKIKNNDTYKKWKEKVDSNMKLIRHVQADEAAEKRAIEGYEKIKKVIPDIENEK